MVLSAGHVVHLERATHSQKKHHHEFRTVSGKYSVWNTLNLHSVLNNDSCYFGGIVSMIRYRLGQFSLTVRHRDHKLDPFLASLGVPVFSYVRTSVGVFRRTDLAAVIAWRAYGLCAGAAGMYSWVDDSGHVRSLQPLYHGAVLSKLGRLPSE